MEKVPSDAQSSADNHLQKKQRTEDKTRSATIDFGVLDCPVCYEPLSPPVFECKNGHLACSVCYPKLSNRCPTCESSIGHIRCRAIEKVLESVFVSCPNEEFGCFKKLTYGDLLSHEKECTYSPLSCPIQDCEYITSYDGLYDHCNVSHFKNYKRRVVSKFSCGIPFTVPMNLGDIKIIMEDKKRLVFVLQYIQESYGVYVTVSVIAPSSLDIGRFPYQLSYTLDGHTLTYESPGMRKIQEVSLETPRDNFMLIPSNFLSIGMLKLTINDLSQELEGRLQLDDLFY